MEIMEKRETPPIFTPFVILSLPEGLPLLVTIAAG